MHTMQAKLCPFLFLAALSNWNLQKEIKQNLQLRQYGEMMKLVDVEIEFISVSP